MVSSRATRRGRRVSTKSSLFRSGAGTPSSRPSVFIRENRGVRCGLARGRFRFVVVAKAGSACCSFSHGLVDAGSEERPAEGGQEGRQRADEDGLLGGHTPGNPIREKFAGPGQQNTEIGEEVDPWTGRERDAERLESEQKYGDAGKTLNPVDQGPVTFSFIARGGPGGVARFISSGSSQTRACRRRIRAGWGAGRKRHRQGNGLYHGGKARIARWLGRTANRR